MTKSRKGILSTIMCLVMLLIGVCALTACGSKDVTVTFSVEGKTQQIEVVDGKVAEMPADPVKEFYSFRGWYTTSTFEDGTEFTKDSEVKADLTVYAYFAPIHVGISVNGSSAEDITLENLAAKTSEFTADAAGKNLTFDGWYIDSAYGTKYTNQDADNLYARYMATVTFDNGYETVATLVEVNKPVSEPSSDDIVKYYMDSEDIFYVDEDGKNIDFSKPITENTTITVLWKTPNLEFEVNESTGNLYFKGFSRDVVIGTNGTMGNYPVFSVPGKVTYNGQLKTVESFSLSNAFEDISYSFRKIIVNEGVKYISGFSGGLNCLVTEIKLPSTLEIVVDSFNNLSSLNKDSVAIPEQTKIIVNSFWKSNVVSLTNYDFDIAIPDSVVNLSQVPTNLKFSANSAFKNIDGVIYKGANGNEKEILIAQYKAENGTLTVEEGVKYVQAGAFFSDILKNVSYIKLPSTWEGMSNNESADKYAYYRANREGSILYSEEVSMAKRASMIIDNLESLERVAVYTAAYPANASSEIIGGTVDGKIKPYTDSVFANENKVVFIGTIADNVKVTVVVRATNRVTGEVITGKVAAIKSNKTALTRQKVLTAVGLWENNHYVILSETQFGEDYTSVYGNKVTCNQYIDIVFEDADGGYTYEKNSDSITITGFNEKTAIDDGNNLFKVVIPATIEGLPVTSIKTGAFKGNTSISCVVIPASVKTIGAESFMNTTNLTTVDITAGGLEEIGRSAFENSGFSSIKLPLSKLKNIEPYAFKSKTLEKFLVADGETPLTDMALCMNESVGGVDAEVGTFGFVADSSNSAYYGIFKVSKKGSEKIKISAESEETEDVIVYDVEYLATAGGTKNSRFRVGCSMRGYLGEEQYSFMAKNAVVRFEMMEGSVYYLDNLANGASTEGIIWGVVGKVHKNAFTDMSTKLTEIETDTAGNNSNMNKLFQLDGTGNEYFTYKYDVWVSTETFSDADIFEDGWWNGTMKSDSDYSSKMQWIDYMKKMNSGTLWG